MPRDIDADLAAAGLSPLARPVWLEVDLDAILANLAAIRQAARGARVVPVVKADAYGHGLVPVALVLERAGVDGLAVASLDEALLARGAGVRTDVLVLQPAPPALAPLAADAGITLTLGDRAHVDAVLTILAARPRDAKPLRVELEIETGLGRGGTAVESAPDELRRLAMEPSVRLAGTWSHLQAPEDEDRSRAQLRRFEEASSGLATERAAGPRGARRHLAASGGVVGGSAPALDAIRPGLALYGLVPDELLATAARPGSLAGALTPAMSLRARPLRVAQLPAGWGVSYGPTWVAARPSRIATLPLGYGDGWPRALSNRADAIVRGRRVPLVGNVAMDAVMADVTDLPGPPVTTADVFTLLGADGPETITAHELAQSRTTNAWEVVTSMSPRIARVYYRAAVPVGLRTLTSFERTGARDAWPGSSSGTGTSATWRSTRS